MSMLKHWGLHTYIHTSLSVFSVLLIKNKCFIILTSHGLFSKMYTHWGLILGLCKSVTLSLVSWYPYQKWVTLHLNLHRHAPSTGSRSHLLPIDVKRTDERCLQHNLGLFLTIPPPPLLILKGPLPNTCGHFWEMVWEQGTMGVVMLNRVIEKGSVSISMIIISISFIWSALNIELH